MPFASGGSGGSMPKATYVENIAERNALFLREGLEVVVIDAIADPNVNAHVAARYRYMNSEWKLLVKYSDLTIVQDYLALTNKPNSVPANIDDAVAKRHEHTNKTVLDNTTASFTNTLKTKLDGIESEANKYIHPNNHPASIISEDSNHRFMTDTEKTKLSGIENNANNYVHPSAHSADMIDETSNKQFISLTLKQFLGLLGESDNKLTFRGSIVDSGTGGDGSYVHPSTHPATMIVEDSTHRFMSDTEKTKLTGIAENANNYSHPLSHSADMIDESSTRKWLSATLKTLLENVIQSSNGELDASKLIITDEYGKIDPSFFAEVLSKFSQTVEGTLLWNDSPIQSSGGSTEPDNITIHLDQNGKIGFICGEPAPNQQIGSNSAGEIVWEDKGAVNVNQQSVMNLSTGDDGENAPSPSNPKTININIPYQTEFKVQKINVLKVGSSSQNVVSTQCDFDAGDSTKFNSDSLVTFDGNLKLKKETTSLLVEQGSLGDGSGSSWYRLGFNNQSDITLEKIEVS